jgi:general secretion pathway protein M
MNALRIRLHDSLQPLRGWYAGLNGREQRIVLWGGIGAAVLLFIGAGVMPLYTATGKAGQRVEQKLQDLTWMRGVAGELRAAGQTVQPGSPGSLIVTVDQSARQAGLGAALTGSQPSGSGGLQVRLENAAFDTVVAWMGALEQQHGIAVESAEINRTARAGIVNATVVLRKAQ